MNKLVAGSVAKFFEGVGSGLVIAVVTATAIFLANKYLLQTEGILTLTKPAESCERDNAGQTCIARVACESDEIAIGGHCKVQNTNQQSVWLLNFGVTLIKGQKDKDPRGFECQWVGMEKNPKPNIVPEVRGICVKKSQFQYSYEALLHMHEHVF